MFSCIISASDNCEDDKQLLLMYSTFAIHQHICNFLSIPCLDPVPDVTSQLLFEHCLNPLNAETSQDIHHHYL